MKRSIILSSTALLAIGVSAGGDINQSKKRPNVIFIIADDLGYGDLSCYGQEKFTTPNIDKLALEGMIFTQCYSGTTVSAPSRASLVTGLHTGHSPIRGNREINPEGQAPLPEGSNTIFKVFKEAGYATGAFGKWGLGFPGSEGEPNKQGVDEFFGHNCQRMAHNYYPKHLYHNTEKIELAENADGNKGVYAQDMMHERSLEFIEKNKDNPFFMFVASVLPHAELAVPEDSLIQKYREMYPETPYEGTGFSRYTHNQGYNAQKYPRATFAAMVARYDVHVGQIVDKLKELGIYENSLIIVTSDNGPHMEGGADPLFFNSNGIYRGHKRDLYEGGVRVPFVASWKAQIPSGIENNHICAFWDMMPTFAEIAGVKSPETDGISILPSLRQKGKQEVHPYIYFEFLELGGRQAVRKGDWKLIRLNVKEKGGSYELYNLAADPSENHNVIKDYPKIADELRAMMAEAHVESPNWTSLK